MTGSNNRGGRRVAVGCLIMVATLVIALAVRCKSAPQDPERDSGAEELAELNNERVEAIFEAAAARRAAESPSDLERVRKESRTKEQAFVERGLALANERPDGWPGMAALKLIACRGPETEQGKLAAEVLISRTRSADLHVLATALPFPTNVSDRPIRSVATIVLERVRATPNHPEAARLLASVVCALAIVDYEGVKPPAEFGQAADVIIERFASSPDIVNFCELLSGIGTASPVWARPFERHLRVILEKNANRAIRVAASFALAAIVQGTDESRQPEAEKLYEKFIKQFDGSEEYYYVNIEKSFLQSARRELEEINLRGLGRPVPEIVGVDLDGRGMKLSEYRGKVVLLSFWATWCGPCIRMVPTERDLVRRLEDRPFAIVGINGDDDSQSAKRAAAKHEMTWRSFASKADEANRRIQQQWNAVFPSFYLIDQNGIIRKRWVGTQPAEELNRGVDQVLNGPKDGKTGD